MRDPLKEVFSFAGVFWALLLVFTQICLESLFANSFEGAVCIPRIVLQGEWWRLVSAAFMHADVAHLAWNCVAGTIFLGVAFRLCGAVTTLLVTLLCGIFANFIDCFIYEPSSQILGASGVVMAALGMVVVSGSAINRSSEKTSARVGRIMAGVALFAFMGAAPNADLFGHSFGFLGGALGGLWFVRFKATAAVGYEWRLLGLNAYFCLYGLSWWRVVTAKPERWILSVPLLTATGSWIIGKRLTERQKKREFNIKMRRDCEAALDEFSSIWEEWTAYLQGNRLDPGKKRLEETMTKFFEGEYPAYYQWQAQQLKKTLADMDNRYAKEAPAELAARAERLEKLAISIIERLEVSRKLSHEDRAELASFRKVYQSLRERVAKQAKLTWDSPQFPKRQVFEGLTANVGKIIGRD